MQFLWKYVDDLIGKGLESYLVLKLLFYYSASMVPLALPLAVMLSSLMLFGNMGESYELTSLKSAGISLLRLMKILAIVVLFISMGAFFFSNNVIPFAHLKFSALLWDITQQKPALNIKEGVFYNGIDGYSILIKKKDPDNRTIYDIKIYDHTSGRGNDNVLVAQRGEMLTSPDKRFLIMKLYNGTQYQEVVSKNKNKHRDEQFRVTFQEWRKVFDLSEFKMTRTDEELFKNHYQMLNISQLNQMIDSLSEGLRTAKNSLSKYIKPYLYFKRENIDSLMKIPGNQSYIVEHNERKKTSEQYAISKRSLDVARNIKGFISINKRDIEMKKTYLAKHEIEWHRKFSLSIACLVLFFIGAPLGAIIRKGGLGMPLVVSVIFFLIFHTLSITGEKLVKQLILSPIVGMWLSTAILLPLGLFLTYKAMNDSKLLNIEWYFIIINKLVKKIKTTKFNNASDTSR